MCTEGKGMCRCLKCHLIEDRSKREHLGIADNGHLILVGVLGPIGAPKNSLAGEWRDLYIVRNIVSFCEHIFLSFIEVHTSWQQLLHQFSMLHILSSPAVLADCGTL